MAGDIAPQQIDEGKTRRPRTAAKAPRDNAKLSHNLNGQKLGRKGRDTRQRIIAAAQSVLENPTDDQLITLSEVARRASMSMGSLYIYFSNLTELMQAVLEPIMASAEEEYIHLLRPAWPDEAIGEHALTFVTAYYSFWKKNGHTLHMRNNMADRGDERMSDHRTKAALPVIRLIAEQMGGGPTLRGTFKASMATALMTGLERIVTVMSASKLPAISNEPANPIDYLIQAEARIFELGIRDMRRQAETKIMADPA